MTETIGEQRHESAAARGKPTDVYVCRDRRTDAVLYVGITRDFPQRQRRHRRREWWNPDVVMTVESTHADEGQARARERALIARLVPLHNVALRDSVATLERAKEQWVEVSYDKDCLDLVEALALASTVEELRRCQRLAQRCMAQRRPSAEEAERRRQRRREVREAQYDRESAHAARRRADQAAEWGATWQPLEEFAKLGACYSRSSMAKALRSGALEGEKIDGVWWTTHDNILGWKALTLTSS